MVKFSQFYGFITLNYSWLAVELKFDTKEHERSQVLHAKFSHDKVPNFVKIAALASIFCCQVRDCVSILVKFGYKLYAEYKFEPNR